MKKKVIVSALLILLLTSSTVVYASVDANVSNTKIAQLIGASNSTSESTVFGLLNKAASTVGASDATTNADGFANASINAKLNYLTTEVNSLKSLCQ